MTTNVPAVISEKVEALFAKDFISRQDFDSLTREEKEQFETRKCEILKNKTGAELYSFFDKISALIPKEANEDIWEFNHDRICKAINETMLEKGRIPSVTEIAKETKLSRPTVRKHLDSYNKSEHTEDREERFKIMRQTLLTVLYNQAMRGNVNALKYYFEATGMANEKKRAEASVIENQHNYIQINNLKLSQEEIQKLSPEKLSQIEQLIRGQAG